MKYVMLKENDEELVDQILNQPFMKSFSELRLYRGLSKQNDEIMKVGFKFRESPKDTDKTLHDMINQESTRMFGVPIRNLMFTYPTIESAEKYGGVNMIVPIGDRFQMFYHPEIHDMTAALVAESDSLMERLIDGALDSIASLDAVNDATESEMIADAIDHVLGDISFETNNPRQEFKDNLQKRVPDIIHKEFANNPEMSQDEKDAILDELYDRKWLESLSTLFSDIMDDDLEAMVNDYLSDIEVVEVSDSDDDMHIYADDNGSEIMVYAPDGFYVIPEMYFDLFE